MDAQSTYIFGYTDAACRVEIVLCAKCGAPFHKVCPNEWRILRVGDGAKYPDGRKCDQCTEQVYYPSISEALAPGRIERKRPITIMSDGQTYEPHRLKVFQEYLETLEF